LDAQEAFDDPRINACNMLIDLVRVRTSDVFSGVMQIISGLY
jgi:DNA-binding XRE family transcriptional regulator